MTNEVITIEKASPARMDEVLEILSGAELPHDGVENYIEYFLVARDGSGKILGCVGLERHGELGLLRSAAVIPEFQGQWIGTKLVRELLIRAAGAGLTEVALLITTAIGDSEKIFVYQEANGRRYEHRVTNSPESNLPGRLSAALITHKL